MKRILFKTQEDLVYLEKKLSKTKDYRIRRKLKFLIYNKKHSNKTILELSKLLGICEKTFKNWRKLYMEYGLPNLLQINNKGKKSKLISEDLHNALQEKLNDGENPFLGYKDAQIWVFETFNLEINYKTLRKYMINHFGSSFKVGRKKHYKQDAEQVSIYKKTS